ncbi:hypothetical protein ACLKA6_010477 [Drosophila palustris]
MAGRADEPSEAEGVILGERAGHSGRYPRRSHNADYEVHSPYNSDDSRGTDPTPDTGRMEWDRLPDSSAIGNIFADEVNRQGAGNFELPILDLEDYAEMLAAIGDIEVAEDLPWEEIDWVEIPADWRTFGLGTMVPAVVLDAVAQKTSPTVVPKVFSRNHPSHEHLAKFQEKLKEQRESAGTAMSFAAVLRRDIAVAEPPAAIPRSDPAVLSPVPNSRETSDVHRSLDAVRSGFALIESRFATQLQDIHKENLTLMSLVEKFIVKISALENRLTSWENQLKNYFKDLFDKPPISEFGFVNTDLN